VIDELGEETQTAPVTLDRVYNFARTNRYAERILTSFLKPMAQAHAKVELIVLSLMQYTTFSLLAEYVFIPTSLAVKDIKDMSIRPSEAGFVDVNQYLQYLQDCVAARGAPLCNPLIDCLLILFQQSPRRSMAVGAPSSMAQFVPPTTRTTNSPSKVPAQFTITSLMSSWPCSRRPWCPTLRSANAYLADSRNAPRRSSWTPSSCRT